VIDIGAHKGYFGAYAVMHGAQRVISYEPEAENFRLLNATAQSFAGRASQWERRRAAVCATSGEVELQVDPASWAHAVSSFKPGAAGPQHASQTVASTSMQDVLAGVTSNGTAGRLIVKIDAEGAECEIVMETSVDLWRLVDEIYVEIHDFAACGPSQIAEYLRRAGFDFVSDQFGVLRMRKPTPG
jgi:FkbM family methyltransferase